MDFTVNNIKQNIVAVARSIGYLIIDTEQDGQNNLVRKLTGNNYPRFHAYVSQVGGTAPGGISFKFSLHLDQKAPIYSGTHAHNGEYFGPVVENEADRIKETLQNNV